jgi:two-component system, NtrC family, C4-dicarboxylate transport sensor histidine kinase DctB
VDSTTNRATKVWRWAIALGLACVVLVTLRLLEGYAIKLAIGEESQRADASAILLESSFRRELEKFRMASVVLARDPDSSSALMDRSPSSIAKLNAKFEALSQDMQAASIYLLDDKGLALASSNWRDPTSFVGKNYSFRAYFQQGIATGSHEQFALGNVSRRPGLYISRRIDLGGRARGVVVIKVEFDQLEAEWQGYGKPAFVTNPAGIVLVTSKPDWRFKSIGRLSVESQKSAALSRDFGEGDISQLAIYADNQVARIGARYTQVPKIIEAVKEPSPNWTVHVLADTQDVVAQAVERTRILVLGSALLLASFVVMDMYRRRAIVARTELAAAERIRELNERLAHSHKLSTLGQIAAGVGHEINQPLAAIGTYASSGIMLIDQGAPKSVRDNLVRIGKLSAQIGDITGELRTFARKSPRRREPVSLRAAIESALLLLHERATSLNAQVTIHGEGGNQIVMAYQGAIEQVIVNLVQNALDACGEGAKIDVAISRVQDEHVVGVSDNGPGLSPEALAGLFQPFTTSKADGLGLGLVISRDLISEFGGSLTGKNEEVGCSFTMCLPASSRGPIS